MNRDAAAAEIMWGVSGHFGALPGESAQQTWCQWISRLPGGYSVAKDPRRKKNASLYIYGVVGQGFVRKWLKKRASKKCANFFGGRNLPSAVHQDCPPPPNGGPQ